MIIYFPGNIQRIKYYSVDKFTILNNNSTINLAGLITVFLVAFYGVHPGALG